MEKEKSLLQKEKILVKLQILDEIKRQTKYLPKNEKVEIVFEDMIKNKNISIEDLEKNLQEFSEPENKIIKILGYMYNDRTIDGSIIPSTKENHIGYYVYPIKHKFSKVHKQYQNATKNSEKEIKYYPIKHIRLDEDMLSLVVNHGGKIIPFKSENKTFKLLEALWESRKQINGEKTGYENYCSLQHLQSRSGCKTTGATYQQIKRLRKKFEKEKLPIIIKSLNNGSYQLQIVITK